MITRILVTIVLILLILALNPLKAYAEGEEGCNNWERIQSIILSEATRQSFEAQLEIARVVVTKGVCFLDGQFYAGYAVAIHVLETNRNACILNTHCRAYFLLPTIDSRVRETAALASHVALTESPRVARYHFDAHNAPLYSWWNNPRACPNGHWVVDLTRVC